jgi:predicted transcriptional regulator
MSNNIVTFLSLNRRGKGAHDGGIQGHPQGNRISFASPDLLWYVLTHKRWEMLQAMTGQGPLSIRDA